MHTFEFNGVKLPIFDHEYNTTARNERAVEISIAMWWLSQHGNGRGLEVGNVLSHYFPEVIDDRLITIVDRYEEADCVTNKDIFEINGEYDYIYSISTLEHVRWDPPEQRDLLGAFDAVCHLRNLLKPKGKMLISIPFGSHPGLDFCILNGDVHADRETVMMLGDGLGHTTPQGYWNRHGGTWHQAESIWWERYGKTTPWAEAVWFGEFDA
jgi:hypothetical protein